MSQELIDYLRCWPNKHPIEDDMRLYKHISKYMQLDKPKWIIDGRAVGRKPFKDSLGRSHQMGRHFEQIEYCAALRSILTDHRGEEAFDKLRRRDFDSKWFHYSHPYYVDESLRPDLSGVVF